MSAPAGRGGRSTAGLRELPPARWVDLGLVVILELVAAVLFVPPFGSPVGAMAAAGGVGAGTVVALVCTSTRQGPATAKPTTSCGSPLT